MPAGHTPTRRGAAALFAATMVFGAAACGDDDDAVDIDVDRDQLEEDFDEGVDEIEENIDEGIDEIEDEFDDDDGG